MIPRDEGRSPVPLSLCVSPVSLRPSAPRRSFPAVFFFVAGALLAIAVRADQWYFEPKASLRGFYDDNVRLISVLPQSSFGAIARAEAVAGRRSEITDIGIDAAVVRRQYTAVPVLNSTDGYLKFDAKHRTERDRFGLRASFAYDSTLTSEVETTGLVQVNKRRKRMSVSPSWTRSLSERSSLDLRLSYLDVTYQDAGLTGLSNYTYGSASLQHSYNLNEITQLFWNLSYDHFASDRFSRQSNSFGLMAGIGHAFSETLSASLLAGVRKSDGSLEFPGLFRVSESSSGPLFKGVLTKRFEAGRLELQASRLLLPSGEGQLLDSKQLNARLLYTLKPRWDLSLRAFALHNTAPSVLTNRQDRKYFSIEPGIEYHLTRWWTVAASYRYRWQKYADRPNDAASNAVFLNLSYVWPREPVARWSLLE